MRSPGYPFAETLKLILWMGRAESDPRRFLSSASHMIIDKIQRIPDIFSYIQSITDNTGRVGLNIFSGSQSFLLNEKISQSLAGRVVVLHLMPFSYSELSRHGPRAESIEYFIISELLKYWQKISGAHDKQQFAIYGGTGPGFPPIHPLG